MALINCPECGRENVSDSAEACPNCGFGIKEYIEEKRYQEELERKQLEEEEKKKTEVIEQSIVANQQNHGCLGVLILLCCLIGGIVLWYQIAIKETHFLIGTFLFIIIIFIGLWAFSSLDPEGYKQASNDIASKHKTGSKLKCPACGSTNIEKISTASRAVSVGMVGLASSKIGKQYKCKACKHMW